MFDLYKRLRNELRKQALVPSLRAVWAWIQHLQLGVAFPPDVEVPLHMQWRMPRPDRGVYEWELAALAKEIIINSPIEAPTDLRAWHSFLASLNKFKNLGNAISTRYETDLRGGIFIELFRMTHHQFGWQHSKRMAVSVGRYYKIFSSPDLARIVETEIGFGTRVLYSIGFALTGHFLQASQLDCPIPLELPGVTPDQLVRFLTRYSMPLPQLKQRCIDSQSYDQDFIYAFNPLIPTPLVTQQSEIKTTLLCPVPTYLIRRYTEGLYYDVCKAKGFDAAFGTAFQAYVGEVIAVANTRASFVVLPESPYREGANNKASVDWIVSDASGELFVECKTKRLPIEAKFVLKDQGPLEAELAKLSEMVVQVYKTLKDAKAGQYSHWHPSDRPIYPIVVTLEEWYVFGHKLQELIDPRLQKAMNSAGLDPDLLEQNPYVVCSVSDFERMMLLAADVGIEKVMDAKVQGKRRLWLLHGAMNDAFPEEYARTRVKLFPDALNDLPGLDVGQ